MKKILMILMITAAATVAAFGQANKNEQAVRQTISDLAVALKNNDVAALRRIYSDDFTFVTDTGVILTKAQRLAAFTSGNLKYESVSFENMSVRLYKQTAVATFSVTTKMASGTKTPGGKFVVTATFAGQNGRWQEVAVQNTRVVE